MLKTVDIGLMANHLLAHKGIIQRLEHYTKMAKDQQVISILNQQIGVMKNHVQVMNQLLDPNQANPVALPPIPQPLTSHGGQTEALDVYLEDRDMTLDANFTAEAMANDNFVSSTHMKDTQVKKLHTDMALQQSEIAKKYEMLAQQLGWLNHPNATNVEQTEAMNPLYQGPPHVKSNQQQTPFDLQ